METWGHIDTLTFQKFDFFEGHTVGRAFNISFRIDLVSLNSFIVLLLMLVVVMVGFYFCLRNSLSLLF